MLVFMDGVGLCVLHFAFSQAFYHDSVDAHGHFELCDKVCEEHESKVFLSEQEQFLYTVVHDGVAVHVLPVDVAHAHFFADEGFEDAVSFLFPFRQCGLQESADLVESLFVDGFYLIFEWCCLLVVFCHFI